jgi:hypothetical protein
MTVRQGMRTLRLCLALLWPLLSVPVTRSAPAPPGLAYTLSGALWTVRTDGSDRHHLTPKYTAYRPELSPDGRLVAYDRVAAACSPHVRRAAMVRHPCPICSLLY